MANVGKLIARCERPDLHLRRFREHGNVPFWPGFPVQEPRFSGVFGVRERQLLVARRRTYPINILVSIASPWKPVVSPSSCQH